MVNAATVGLITALHGTNDGAPTVLVTDKTLALENRAADAKAVGDYIAKLERRIATLEAGGITVTTPTSLFPLFRWIPALPHSRSAF